MLFNFVKPSNIQNWIKTNASGSYKSTATDSWNAYLAANGGTGATQYDREMNFLNAAGFTTGSLYDRWQAYLAANGGGTGKSRDKFNSRYH